MTIAPSPGAFATVDAEEARDRRFMRLALSLARRHLGQTWPNPSVGCVIVRDDGAAGSAIVAAGPTRPGGRPHAERVALEKAGEAARGATLYVSLEPCSHHGKTPPCAEAIVAAGIRRVVSAVEDPNPLVAGQGHAILRRAGITVTSGVLTAEAAYLNRGHFTRIRTGRPSVTVKLARTADGFAGRAGERLIVTGEAANAIVHLMRARADAILVGIGTVLADDPQLTVRLSGLEDRSPVRLVLDTNLHLPLGSRLVAAARQHPTWVACGTGATHEREAALITAGVTVIRVPEDAMGRVDLHAAMRALAERGLTRVLCEGGPILAEALAQAKLVEEVELFTASKRLDSEGVAGVRPRLTESLAKDFVLSASETMGPDRRETFAPRES